MRHAAVVALVLSLGPLPVESAEPLLKDRDPGGHAIEYVVTLDAPPDEVFALWSTAEGLRRFLAPGATVDGEVGGLHFRIWDSGDLADKLATLLTDRETWRKLGEAGPRIARYYSVPNLADRILTHLGLSVRP